MIKRLEQDYGIEFSDLEEILSKLDPRIQKVIDLKLGLSTNPIYFSQIKEKMNISESRAKQLYDRGMRRIREDLDYCKALKKAYKFLL